MSTSRLDEHLQKKNRLEKTQFIAKFCESLKNYTSLGGYPEQYQSQAVQKAAEQGWRNYLIVGDFFDKGKIVPGRLKVRETFNEDTGKLFYEANCGYLNLGSRIDMYLLDSIESFSEQERNETQFIVNLPAYSYSLSECKFNLDKMLVNYSDALSRMVANTNYLQALTTIKLGANIDQYCPFEGNTPLLLSVSKGWNHQNLFPHPNDPQSKDPTFYPQKEIIKCLLEKKADVNAIHLANGMTALHIACLRGDNPELIRLLLENGAQFDTKDYDGHTPLDLLGLDYELVKRIITRLTNSQKDQQTVSKDNMDFGIKLFDRIKLPEYQSDTATLPTLQERNENQKQIEEILKARMLHKKAGI